MAQRPREHDGVNSASRSAGDDVNDDTQLHLAADLAQELKIVGLSVVFGIVRIGLVEERCLGAQRTISDPVQATRGAQELQDLLADAMHIDGERNAAEADKRDAKFFLAQERPPEPRAPSGAFGVLD